MPTPNGSNGSPLNPFNWTFQFSGSQLITLGGCLVTAVMMYNGITGKIELQGADLTTLKQTNAELTAELKDVKTLQQAQERALLELTVTLKTKGLIK